MLERLTLDVLGTSMSISLQHLIGVQIPRSCRSHATLSLFSVDRSVVQLSVSFVKDLISIKLTSTGSVQRSSSGAWTIRMTFFSSANWT